MILPFATAGIADWFKKNVRLAPSQSTDVRIEVGNVAPSITSISPISPVSLNPAPSTTNVLFTFTATDPNDVTDLNDASASSSFTKTGEPTRTGSCVFLSQTGTERTYQCTVTMQYFDAPGTWDVAVSIQDSAGLTGTSSSTFSVNLLTDITISPTIVNFPTVVQGASNVISSSPTTVTNRGNFQAPPGTLSITAFDLAGETLPAELIPATNLRAAGSSGAAVVCSTGNALSNNVITPITSVNLPRGPSGSNTETIAYCLTLVPSAISSQFYSATGASGWIMTIS